MLLFSCPASYGDGWHVSDRDGRLREPVQKAIVSWDGRTETLVLSSAVQAEEIANFAWIVPIASSVKPEVSAGDISIFEELAEYFRKDKHLDKGVNPRPFIVKRGGGGVKILESKEIDVYDITILEAECAEDLIHWLNGNAYIVPEEAGPVLEQYIKRQHTYFIANRIDLRNRYSDDIDEVHAIYERKELEYQELCDRLTEYFNELAMDDSIFHLDYRSAPGGGTNDDFFFLAKEYRSKHPGRDSVLNILTRYLTDALNEEFRRRYGDSQTIIELGNGWSIRGSLELVLTVSHEPDTYGHLIFLRRRFHRRCRIFQGGEEYTKFSLDKSIRLDQDRTYEILTSWSETAKIKSGADKYANLSEKDKALLIDFFHEAGGVHPCGRANDLFHEALKRRDQIVAEKLEPILAELSSLHFLDIDQYRDLFHVPTSEEHEDTLFKQIGRLRRFSHNIDDDEKSWKKFDDLYFTLYNLSKGVGTPLKIVFQPPQPCYPLKISSLNTGKSRIDVFVLDARPVDDQSAILHVDDSKMITLDLREAIAPHIDVGRASYVTKLTYWGELEKLSADAVFVRVLHY
jgi:hypothetical protein